MTLLALVVVCVAALAVDMACGGARDPVGMYHLSTKVEQGAPQDELERWSYVLTTCPASGSAESSTSFVVDDLSLIVELVSLDTFRHPAGCTIDHAVIGLPGPGELPVLLWKRGLPADGAWVGALRWSVNGLPAGMSIVLRFRAKHFVYCGA